jgi:hypothetical protein
MHRCIYWKCHVVSFQSVWNARRKACKFLSLLYLNFNTVKYSTRLRFFQATYSYVLFNITLKERNITHLSVPVFNIYLEGIFYFHICSAENVDNDFQQKINYSNYTSRNFAFRSLLVIILLSLICLCLPCTLFYPQRENTSLYHLALG